MNWIDFMSFQRAIGTTTAMAAAIKACDGVLVCRNSDEAQRVAKQYGIKTASIQESTDRHRGTRHIYLPDPDALPFEFSRLVRQNEAVHKENEDLRRKLFAAEQRVALLAAMAGTP